MNKFYIAAASVVVVSVSTIIFTATSSIAETSVEKDRMSHKSMQQLKEKKAHLRQQEKNVNQKMSERKEQIQDNRPAIHNAIADLQAAQMKLKKAPGDFGGHRAKALSAIDEAVNQLEHGLQYDSKH